MAAVIRLRQHSGGGSGMWPRGAEISQRHGSLLLIGGAKRSVVKFSRTRTRLFGCRWKFKIRSKNMSRLILIALLGIIWASNGLAEDTYLGKLSTNPYGADSTSNPYGSYGSEYSGKSINNSYGQYGSPYSNKSAANPYATDAPKLYDSNGNYRGRLSTNPYDPDSTSNPYGRYGSKYSPDSINNKYGAGSPYKVDSPNNPYGEGVSIYGDDDG